MKKYNKLCLFLGLLILTPTVNYTHEEELATLDQINIHRTEAEVDAELYKIVKKLLDGEDKTSISELITQITDLLKVKRDLLPLDQHAKYDEIIKLLEDNKDSSSFNSWAKILPSLKNLMPKNIRAYINGLPVTVVLRNLATKLNSGNNS